MQIGSPVAARPAPPAQPGIAGMGDLLLPRGLQADVQLHRRFAWGDASWAGSASDIPGLVYSLKRNHRSRAGMKFEPPARIERDAVGTEVLFPKRVHGRDRRPTLVEFRNPGPNKTKRDDPPVSDAT